MSKSKQLCSLKIRQVKVTNMNYQPEKAGSNTLMPRVDLSLEVELDDMDIAELVRVRTGSSVVKTLWDESGAPVLLDVGPMKFEIQFKGKVEFRFVNDESHESRRTSSSSWATCALRKRRYSALPAQATTRPTPGSSRI